MKKPTWLYIPLILLFLFALTVLVIHTFGMRGAVRELFNATDRVRSPFLTVEKTVVELRPEAAIAGIKQRDEIIAVNGKPLINDYESEDRFAGAADGETANFTVQRRSETGEIEQKEIFVTLHRIERNTEFYGRFVVGLAFANLLPAFCLLLGFWVVFVRPRDFQAWLLLFLLLGLGAVGLESDNSVWVKTFRNIFFNQWSLAMFLFGIYFPERWNLDKKIPWAKWILIAPLGLQILDALIEQTSILLGFNYHDPLLRYLPGSLTKVLSILNIAAISIFFVALGTKSGTLENKDSRRRLKLLLTGTMIAMMPSFIIVIIGTVRGQDGFFNIVPSWFAILAIVLLLLFPLTLAYVIVVERAMDVSVVVRQGLQYALARNVVLAVQILLSIGIIFAAVSLVSNAETNVWLKIIFISVGISANVLVGKLANRIKLWTDKRFFREAYNSEQILSDLSEQVRTMVETRPLLEIVSNKIAESLHVPQVAFLLRNGINFQPAYALGFAESLPVAFGEKTATVDKLRKNEAITVYADDKESWINTQNLDAERENLEKLNSQLLLPVGVKEKLLGFLSLSPKKSEEPYTANDLRLLKSVAAQTGLALENSRLTEEIVSETALRERLNREVEIAREVQERLFPQDLPKIKNLDYWGACRPALGVGGDYYDFFELENGKFGIAIGDVSGKGIGASLMMASLQASLRGQAIHFDEDLAALMCNVNRLVYETSTSNRYATFFYSQFDPATGKLTYVNAGHNPPFLFRKTKETRQLLRLETGGAVVGMLPPMLISYEQGEIEMQPGDLLIGFTDGISEAMNPADEEWGEEQMIQAINAKIDLPAKEMLDYLVSCADDFANGAKQHDDMTAIIVRMI